MFDVLRNFLSREAPSNKVIEVTPDSYSDRHIFCREDCLVLYEPQAVNKQKERRRYDIVLHRPCTESLHHAYRLGICQMFFIPPYRASGSNLVRSMRDLLKEHIPPLQNPDVSKAGSVTFQIADTGTIQNPDVSKAGSVSFQIADTVLRNFLSREAPSNKVIEVTPDSYSDRHIFCREDCLVLYEPQAVNKQKERRRYDIVLHRPCTESLHHAYSLFRSEDKEETEIKFVCLKERVPEFIEISKEMCNMHGLQKICDVLSEHPGWSLAHLAVHFGLYDAFKNAKVNSYLNSSDPSTGMSPLQVAVATSNLRMVQILVAAKCSLEHLDFQANTVFHYAAATNKDIIAVLSQSIPLRCLNSLNKNGHTPLHEACLKDKPDCVKALLLAGADVNIAASQVMDQNDSAPGYVGDFLQDNPNTLYQQDMKFGGTPLHWAGSRAVIETLVDMNCNINAINFQQCTALHIMVLRNRLECVAALMSRNADPNLGDCDGNTPLHLSVKTNNVPIIQCLVVFGANLDVINNSGHTPRHIITKEQEPKLLYYLHAVGAKRCPSDMEGCTDGCRFNGTYDGISPNPVIGPANREVLNQMLAVAGMEVSSQTHGKKPASGGRLLCLDGGGIKGLVLIQMLLALEDITGMEVKNCFDWIAGTSTGGILALAIAIGKNMKQILSIYFRMKEIAFVGLRPYPSEALENILKESFGTETVMTDIKSPKLLITGVLADRKPVELHLFRNYKSPSDILEVKHDSPYELPPPPEEQLLWHVGRATGAAPTYFRAFGRFLDGGLIANNPTLDALTEIQEYNLSLRAVGRDEEITPVTVVVSFGTGLIPVTQLKGIDVFRPESIWDTTKLVMGISSLGTLLVDQATAADGRVVDRARAWCSMIGVPYFRFSPQLSEDISMDEKSDATLCKMLWEAKAYMYSNLNPLKEVADILNR